MGSNDLTTLAMRLRPLLVAVTSGVINQVFEAGEGPGINLVGTVIGVGLDSILLVHANGNPASEYTTITAACSAAASGDIIIIARAGTFNESFTIPAGVGLVGLGRDQTIITGQVTLSHGSMLWGVSVVRTGTTETLYGVVGPVTAQSRAAIINCKVSVTVTSGTAIALYINGGEIADTYSEYYAWDTIGLSYGVYVVGSDPVSSYTLDSWNYPTRIKATGAAMPGCAECHYHDIKIPIVTKGGVGNTALIHGAAGGGWASITYDLGAAYTMTQLNSYMDYNGQGSISGSLNGTDWTDIKVLLTGGYLWALHTTEINPPATYRYIKYYVATFPMVGGDLSLGYFQVIATAGWKWGAVDLHYSSITGRTDDIHVVTGAARVYACRYNPFNCSGIITSRAGDRSTWYAADYADEHADDIDTPAGIHHTLGTGTDQAAMGDHTHEATELKSTGVINGWIATADGSDGIIFEEHLTNENTGGGDLHLYIDGRLAVLTDVGRFVIPRDGTIERVTVTVKDKGAANSTIIDVHKNGTTVFTTQTNRPTVAYNDADGVASGVPDVTVVAAGDVITIDLDAIATGAGTIEIVVAMNYATLADSQFTWTYSGQVEVETVPIRLYNRTGRTKTIKKIWLGINTAPTGAAIIVDVLKNGITIFTTPSNRPSIAAGAFAGSSVNVEVDQWLDGEYLTYAIIQVGSTVKGSDLSINVVYT